MATGLDADFAEELAKAWPARPTGPPPRHILPGMQPPGPPPMLVRRGNGPVGEASTASTKIAGGYVWRLLAILCGAYVYTRASLGYVQ